MGLGFFKCCPCLGGGGDKDERRAIMPSDRKREHSHPEDDEGKRRSRVESWTIGEDVPNVREEEMGEATPTYGAVDEEVPVTPPSTPPPPSSLESRKRAKTPLPPSSLEAVHNTPPGSQHIMQPVNRTPTMRDVYANRDAYQGSVQQRESLNAVDGDKLLSQYPTPSPP